MRNNQEGFGLVAVLLVLLTVGLIIVSGLYVSKNNINREATNKTTSEPVADDKQETAEKPKQDKYPVNGFSTGQVVFRDDFPDYFDVRIKSSDIDQPVKAIWVEYGGSPVELTGKTREVTDELGLGGDAYGSWAVVIEEGTFSDGQTYFYRAVARLQDNTLIYGGIAAFDAPK